MQNSWHLMPNIFPKKYNDMICSICTYVPLVTIWVGETIVPLKDEVTTDLLLVKKCGVFNSESIW